jgi:hypothetical protein
MLFQLFKGGSTRWYLILQGLFHSFAPTWHPFAYKKYILKQMKYVELTCLLGGSMLSWSVVLVILL